MPKEDPFEGIRKVSAKAGEFDDEERRNLIYQALIYAEELKDLYGAEKARADELEAAKNALDSSAERMRLAERAKDEFIANCSHELRTPLTPIIGWSKFLSTRDVSKEEVREFAQTIQRSGNRLLQVVDSLLRVASIERNYKRTIVSVKVDIEELLDSVARTIHTAGRPVEITVEPRAKWAMSEREYLSEVLLHLVDNAIKFAPKGSTIHLAGRGGEEELIVSVADQGPGVPEPDRDRVFQAFTQVDSSSTRQFGGLGAGLYICRELVEAHGGRIWVEEAPGGGARFLFTIPQHRTSDWIGDHPGPR